MSEPLKPLIEVGFGTGTPAGFPDYRPLNPWGRPMPRTGRKPRPQLWQIVLRRHGKEVPFGPKMPKEVLEPFFKTVELGIRTGQHPELSSPHMVMVDNPLAEQEARRQALRHLQGAMR
jgi:hypothetical protein